jgi:O-antigen biosynthesis protein
MIKLNKSMAIRPHKLPPSAWHGHIPFAAWLVEELRPSLFVELGTHHGASYLGFCQAVSELAVHTRCYAIDTWKGDEHAEYYDDSVFEELRSYHDERYHDFSKLLRCTFDEGVEKFDPGSIDLLHIDGLHTYDAVKHDFESWLPKLSNRAVVLFHDLDERKGSFGVWRLWGELTQQYPSFAFSHSHGLGVLIVGEQVPESVRALAALDSVQNAVVNSLFAVLGHGVQLAYERNWWRAEVEKVGGKAGGIEVENGLLRAQIQQASEQLSSVMEELAAVREAEHRQNTEHDGLNSELSLEKASVQALAAELETLKSTHEGAIGEIASAREALQRESEGRQRLEAMLLEESAAAKALREELAGLMTELESIRDAQQRQASDIRDRDELIASLAKDLHQARAMLDSTATRIGRAIEKARLRWAPEGTLAGQLVARAIRRAIAFHDRKKGRSGPQVEEPLKALVGPAGTPSKAMPKDFAAYIDAYEPKQEQLELQRQSAESFGYAPRVSFVIPIYRLPREILEHTLLSVEAQTYPKWEACLAWADTEDEAGWQWLQQRCTDSRYKLVRLQENGGISKNSNAALELVSGEFVALLDHDDTIAPWALHDMVQALQEHPDADFLYSDKDSLTESGDCRLNALFKPEWSPEMLHSVNYLTHLNLMRTEVVRAVGAWDPETDGAQDWDIFFRVTSVSRKVLRVPSIHYHWRILPTSTSTGLQTKPYAIMGQLRSQKNYFARKRLPAQVSRTEAGMFHITWPSVAGAVEVIVLQDGDQDHVVNVLDVLLASNGDAIRRITVLHRAEAGPALLAFQDHLGDRFSLVRQDDLDWSAAVSGIRPDTASVVVVSGRALGLSGGIIQEMAGWTQHHPDIAWVGSLAVDPAGKVLEAGRVVATDGSSAPMFRGCYPHEYGWFGGALWYRNVGAVSGHVVAFKAAALKAGLEAVPEERRKGKQAAAHVCRGALVDSGMRGLLDPFAVVYLSEAEENWDNDGSRYWSDPYFSPAFGRVNPLRLK